MSWAHVQELASQVQWQMGENGWWAPMTDHELARQTLREIAADHNADPKARLDAARLLIDASLERPDRTY